MTIADQTNDENRRAETSGTEITFRDGMARLGAAVNIVTTNGPAGRAGFAATAVCSVSDSPPTLLVCLNRSSSAYSALRGNGVLCVNVLSSEHQELSAIFGGRTPMNERFEAASWSPTPSGALALSSALISFDCRIKSVADGNTHDVLLCEVVKTESRNSHGLSLIYFNRQYHHLSAMAAT